MVQPYADVRDPSFGKLLVGSAYLEKLWTGGRWLEGPAYFAAGRYLVFSDIPNNRMMRFDEADGSVSEFRKPSNNANGNTRDREGRLISCEHHARRVTRTEVDGSVTVIASHYEGKRLNSPNDVVVAADGAVWFTDPTYGIDADYEGERADSEIGASYVYRVDPETAAVEAVATDFVQPNGIAFAPDGSQLFVADTGVSHVTDGPRHIRRFSVDGKRVLGGEVFATCDAGVFDGFRFDEAGRLWSSAHDGVHCFNPSGELLGKIKVPEIVANVCFGTRHRIRLYICGTSSLYALYLKVRGASYPS